MSCRLVATALAVVALAGSGCDRAPNEPSRVSATDQFAAALRAQGLGLSIEGAVPTWTTPYFSPQATQLAAPISEVHGPARILVFEYEREADAAAEAANVRPDGQPSRTSLITWVATPRFYRQGRLIALYVGCDARILGALQNVAGSPFVVGATPCTRSGL